MSLGDFDALVAPALGCATALTSSFASARDNIGVRRAVVDKITVIRLADGQLLQALSAHSHAGKPAAKFGVDVNADRHRHGVDL